MAIPRVAAGELRQQIQILVSTLAQDSSGGVAESSVALLATVWAKIVALSGRELYSAQQKVAEVTHKITIRYMPGLKAGMLVLFADPGGTYSRIFQIQAIENPDELTILLNLLCIERDDSARESTGILGATTISIMQPLTFTATEGQTVFTLPYPPPRGAQVFWGSSPGGLMLQSTPADYSISGTTLTLTRGAMAGDTLIVYYL